MNHLNIIDDKIWDRYQLDYDRRVHGDLEEYCLQRAMEELEFIPEDNIGYYYE